MSGDDVPSPVDFHELAQAKEWEAHTLKKKAVATAIFYCFRQRFE
jgi:hypothetical protein